MARVGKRRYLQRWATSSRIERHRNPVEA